MFDAYTFLLMLSGLLLIAIGATFGGQSIGSRLLSVAVGIGFFGYGFYLEFLFEGGTYRVFFFAFVFPVLLTIRAIKERQEARATQAAQAAQAARLAAERDQPGYVPQEVPQEGR
ncbi:hypothetical protein [Micromonospora sp. NPDC004704]